MTTSSDRSDCPKCGAPVPGDAPHGLCPKCVLGGAATERATTSPAGRVPPPPPEEIAPHFPDLEIVEVVGAGGMGAVYKARQPKLDRFVALKILTQDLASDPAFVERFNREARVLARLNHPNIVTVFDFGTAGPFCYLLMEFVDGVNLRQAMHSGGFTPSDSLALVQDVCGALSFAHEEGILHRDIKPENILIDARGRVKIADFGIAKLVGEGDRNDVTLTLQGAILGSPQYMAPEQIETPGDIDQRADIYSLGVVFYELLTGELPLGRFAPPSEKSSLDPRIDEIVMRTLEKERQLRYQSADEIKTKVQSISQSGSPGGTAGGAASATPGASPAPVAEEASAESAKFATASAILTGVGLLFATVFFVSLPLIAFEVRENLSYRVVFGILVLVAAISMGLTLLLGIIFGGKALGEIRRSGGQKLGMGSAMFGTLAVPVLLILGMTAGTAYLLAMVISGDANILATALVAAAVIAGPVSFVMLVRSVGRWARGASDPAGGVTGGHVAGRIGIVCLALVLNLGTLMIWLAPVYRSEGVPGSGHGPRMVNSSSSSSRTIGDVPHRPVGGKSRRALWDLHWPEFPHYSMQLMVPAGHAATFELVRTSPSGEQQVEPLWSAIAPDTEELEGIIAFGAPEGLQKQQQPGVGALKGTIWSARGEPVFVLNKFFQGKLQLNRGGRSIDLSNPNRDKANDTVQLGRIKGDDINSEKTLAIRVVSAPRPGSGNGFALVEELLGSGSPEDVINEWKKRNSPASKPEAAPAEVGSGTPVEHAGTDPEIELDFVAPAGRVSVFALQAPWDQDHQSPDDWYIVAPDSEDITGKIKMRTVGEPAGDGRGLIQVMATLHDSSGKTVRSHQMTIPGDHRLSVLSTYPFIEMDEAPDGETTGAGMAGQGGKIDLAKRGVHFIGCGVRNGSDLDDSLRLLAWSRARPESDQKIGAGEGRVGPATPPDVLDRWIQLRRKRQNASKWSEPLGEKIASVVGGDGVVLVRSGYLFDTRERAVEGRSDLFVGETLFFEKGSKASLTLPDATSIEVDAEAEDTMLVFHMPTGFFIPPLSGLKAEVGEVADGGGLVIDTAFGASLTIRGKTAFHLSGQGHLEVWEGEVEITHHGEEGSRFLKAGSEYAFPKPELPDERAPAGDRGEAESGNPASEPTGITNF